ncbi:MAG: phage portal protein [Desulfovibrionaceae bacterium]
MWPFTRTTKAPQNASPENPSTNLSKPDSWLYDAFGGAKASTGVMVNEETALRVSAVYRCVTLLASGVSSLPCGIFVPDGKGGKVAASEHPAYSLVHSTPNTMMTAVTMWDAFMWNVLLRGNGYAIIDWGRDGHPRELFPVPASLVRVEQESGRSLRYFVKLAGGGEERVPMGEMLHVPGPGWNGMQGMSVIANAAREAVGLSIAAEQFVAKMHANAARPSGFVKTKKTMSTEAMERLKATFDKLHAGVGNSGKTAVLDNEMEWQQAQINPVDVQTLESRRFQVVDIARIFGVPPHLVFETDKTTAWGSGIEQQGIGFVQYSLRPWIVRIEQEINRKLFGYKERKQNGYYAEFNLSGMLRGDSKTRSDFYSSAIQNGWMTPNEARKLENLPAVPGGDTLFIQQNLQPIDAAGAANGDTGGK